jgi:hypothetical protein
MKCAFTIVVNTEFADTVPRKLPKGEEKKRGGTEDDLLAAVRRRRLLGCHLR